MTEVLRFRDEKQQIWARLTLTSKEPIWVSVAQTGVIVKPSRLGLFGPTLYVEKRVYDAGMAAKRLNELYPLHGSLPLGIRNIVLRSLVNAILHCGTAAQVAVRLNEAGVDNS